MGDTMTYLQWDDVFDVVVEGVTKGDHLDQRREEHEEQRERIPQHREEFLVENGVEAAEHIVYRAAGGSFNRCGKSR